MAINLAGWVIAQQTALNNNVSKERASQLGLVGALLPNPVMSALLVQQMARNEAPPVTPAATVAQTTGEPLRFPPVRPAESSGEAPKTEPSQGTTPATQTGSQQTTQTGTPGQTQTSPVPAAVLERISRIEAALVEVPYLIDKTFDEAAKMCADKGLVAVKVEDITLSKTKTGKVTAQKPDAKALVSKGVTVVCTVAPG